MADVELATNALCTKEDVKEYMRLETVSDDHLIDALINRASDMIEDEVGQPIINRQYTEKYDGDGSVELLLNHFPIVSVTSLAIDDVAVAADDYLIYADAGYLYCEEGFTTEDRQNVDVTYTAGMGERRSDIPQVFPQACLKCVSVWYRQDAQDYSTTYGEGHEVSLPRLALPASVKEMIAPYKHRRLA